MTDSPEIAAIREAVERLERNAARCQNPNQKLNECNLELTFSECRALLDALDTANQRAADAERVEREAAVAWLRKVASDYRNSIFFEAGIVTPAIQDEARADAIARGKHREGKGNG